MLKRIVTKYQKLSPNLQKLTSNVSWLFAQNALRMGIGLFVGIWVARYLGAKQFGLYNYALSFVMLFTPLIQLGLGGIVVRDLVREPSSRNEILGTAFILKLIGGVATLLLTVGIIMYLRPEDSLSHLLVGIVAAGTIFRAFETIDFWFQSQIQSKYTVFAQTTAFLLISIVKILLIQMKAPLIAFALAGLANTIVGSVGRLMAYNISGSLLTSWSVSFSRARVLLNESWPLLFSGAAIMIQAYIDQIMLGQMIGDSEVGQYSVAMKLIAVFGFVPMIICQSVAPMITQAKLKSHSLYLDRLKNLYRLMFVLFLSISIPIFLFSDKIVIILFGQEYQPAGVLLSLFSIRLFFTNFGVAKSLFITNESLFKYSLISAIVGSLVNIGMNYILIPEYASVGAIWATIGSFTTTIFIVDLFYPRMHINLGLMIRACFTPWRLNLGAIKN